MYKKINSLLTLLLLILSLSLPGCSKPKEEYKLLMTFSPGVMNGLTKDNNVYDFGEVVWPANINFSVYFNVDYFVNGKHELRSFTFFPENNHHANAVGLKSYKLEDKEGNILKTVPDRKIEKWIADINKYQITSIGKHTFEFVFPDMPQYGIEETHFYVVCTVLEEEEEKKEAIIILEESDADYTVVEKFDGANDLYILNNYTQGAESFPRFVAHEKNEENIYGLYTEIANIHSVEYSDTLFLYCKKLGEDFQHIGYTTLPQEKGIYLCHLRLKNSSEYKSMEKVFYVAIN